MPDDPSNPFSALGRNEDVDLTATILERPAPDAPVPQAGSPENTGHFGRMTAPNTATTARYLRVATEEPGTAEVPSEAEDHLLRRRVLVHHLPTTPAEPSERAIRFKHDALMMASLEHSHIAPLYDLGWNDDGSAFVTMRSVNGARLDELLRQAIRTPAAKSIAGLHERVEIFQKVLNAVASAHHRRIIHRDITPSHIMIGTFGEVFLTGWECARSLDDPEPLHPQMIGTPNYMSPEQARGECGDERSDIYALGATLFEILIGRVPTRAATKSVFWEMKRSGTIKQLTNRERRSIPKPLAAILTRALQAEPTHRYPSAEALIMDLRAWSTGQRVDAYREGIRERTMRLCARYARRLWLTTLALIAVAAGVTVIWGGRLKEMSTWGPPVISEDFESGVLGMEWITSTGSWTIRDGRLVSEGSADNLLWLKQPFAGNVAVEYTGRMLPGFPPCDLSVAWSHSPPQENAAMSRLTLLQAGARDNSYVSIVVDGRKITQAPVRLVTGRDYRIRMEVEGEHLRIIIDGEKVLEYRNHVPFGAGYVALFAYYPGKSFDDLRISAKNMPEQISVLAPGERDLVDGLYDRAAEYFSTVANAHAGKQLGEEALYRQGVALWKNGRTMDAKAVWAKASDPVWRGRISLHYIEGQIESGNFDAALPSLGALLTQQPELREQAANVWTLAAHELPDDKRWRPIAESLIIMRDRYLSDVVVTDSTMAMLLSSLGRPEEILKRFPHVTDQCAQALIDLGRPAESLQLFGDGPAQRVSALLALGRFDEILNMEAPPKWALPETLVRSGADPELYLNTNYLGIALLMRGGRAALEQQLAGKALDEENGRLIWPALLLGWEQRLVDEFPRVLRQGPSRKSILLTEAWVDDESKLAFVEQDHGIDIPFSLAMTRYRRGDIAVADALMNDLRSSPAFHLYDGQNWFVPLATHALAHLMGDEAPLNRLLHDWETRGPTWGYQRPWFAANVMLGRIDEAGWNSQPMKTVLPSTLMLLQGLRADIAQDATTAKAAYMDFLAQEPWMRNTNIPDRDPPAELWARWRVEVLGKTAE